jgi:hypothetical protein
MLRELWCKRKQLLTMQKKGYTDAINSPPTETTFVPLASNTTAKQDVVV